MLKFVKILANLEKIMTTWRLIVIKYRSSPLFIWLSFKHMHHYLNIAIKAARNAGKVISRHFDSVDTLKILEKGPNVITTLVDKAAEMEIINVIQQAYPSHAILGEETGESKDAKFNEEKDCTWIIDPINGTTNFAHGYPQFAISIAIRHKDQIEHGLIYDPISQELFVATRGAGTQLNGRRLRILKQNNFSSALIGTSFPLHAPEKQWDTYIMAFREIASKCRDIRRTGSSALDLAYIAAGRLDGYWGEALRIWDVAAGALIVKEAGGFVGDYRKEGAGSSGNIVAGTRKVYAGLSHVLEEV